MRFGAFFVAGGAALVGALVTHDARAVGTRTFELDTLDKPMIGMGDEKWEGRVHLGFVEPDVLDPASDDWRLSFSPFGTTRPIASMGMFKAGAGQEEGRLTISGRRIQ